MRVTDSLVTSNLLAQINSLESQQTKLQGEVSSGLSVTMPEDNPSVMAQALDLQTSSSANTQYQSNIAGLLTTASAAGDAMNSLQTVAEQASTIATESDNINSSTQLSSYAAQVENLIQEAVQAANAQDAQGNYLFGGSATSQPPFVATTDASGNITGVTYQGNSDAPSNQIGLNLNISAVVPGANTSGSGPEGLLVDSRTGADFFNHLIALQQDLASGNTSNISSTDQPNLTKDQDSIIAGIAANGVTQAALQSAQTSATQWANTLTNENTGLTSADLATTLTNLDQVQTSLQAAMQSGVKIINLSILDFLQ